MKKNFYIILFLILTYSQWAHSDELTPDYAMEVNLSDYCKADSDVQNGEKNPSASPTPNLNNKNCSDCSSESKPQLSNNKNEEAIKSKRATCSAMNQYAVETSNKPIEIIQKDKDGKKWKIRFYFGPTRTQYNPTDVHIISSKVNVVIKDFSFAERTSQDAYDPTKWKNFENYLQWIDEPTNTMMLEFQKGKNSFFINVYHPKFLTNGSDVNSSVGNIQGEVDGKYINKPMDVTSDGPTNSKRLGLKLQNTHRQMDWQIGYGRRIDLVNFKTGKVVLTPHVAVGITTGKTQSTYLDEAGNTFDYESSGEIQGMNVTLGNRMAYEKGRFSLFLDESLTLSQLKHPILDGTAFYDMRYITNTVGISFQINKTK